MGVRAGADQGLAGIDLSGKTVFVTGGGVRSYAVDPAKAEELVGERFSG